MITDIDKLRKKAINIKILNTNIKIDFIPASVEMTLSQKSEEIIEKMQDPKSFDNDLLEYCQNCVADVLLCNSDEITKEQLFRLGFLETSMILIEIIKYMNERAMEMYRHYTPTVVEKKK